MKESRFQPRDRHRNFPRIQWPNLKRVPVRVREPLDYWLENLSTKNFVHTSKPSRCCPLSEPECTPYKRFETQPSPLRSFMHRNYDEVQIQKLPHPGRAWRFMARSWLNWVEALDAPVPGCVAVLYRDDPCSWEGQVGFYLRHDASFFYLLGGNHLEQAGAPLSSGGRAGLPVAEVFMLSCASRFPGVAVCDGILRVKQADSARPDCVSSFFFIAV